MKTKVKTTQITTLGLMMAILLLMAYTPLGYLNIGPLAITFNVIPVAISAIALGPAGGAAAGSIFEICPPVSGRPAAGIYFQRNEEENQYLYFLRGHRILFRIFEYRIFYDGSGASFWKHRIYERNDRRRKYNRIYLYICGNQCRM